MILLKNVTVGLMLSWSTFFYAMEESPLAKVEKEQERYQQAQKCAEQMRDKIDKEMLGIDQSSWFRGIIGTYYSSSKLSSLKTRQEIPQALGIIESYIPPKQDHELVMKALVAKHQLAAWLVDELVNDEVKQLHEVNGNTIDHVLDARRIIPNLSPLMSTFVKAKALMQYKDKNSLANYLPDIPFDRDNEIHFIPLFQHEAPIDLKCDKLLMSSDSKYLRAIGATGDITVWDMENGNVVDNFENTTVAWTRSYEDSHHCRAQRVIDKNDKYLATPGMAPAFGSGGIRDIQCEVRQKYSFPVIMLFVRPTIMSHISQDAFWNSKGDEKALRALYESQALNKVKGFPSANLKRLIEQELANLKQAKL